MILAASQPAFMMYPGYLDRIRQADVFVLLTGVQFEKNSFINRNQIKTQHGAKWLTVPVKLKKHTDGCIASTRVDRLKHWRKHHLETIRHAYRKAPRFEENWPKIEALYEQFKTPNFMEIFGRNLVFWLKEYGLIKRPPNIGLNNFRKVRTPELIHLCHEYGCDTYLSGPLGRDYLDESAFKEAGIKLEYHDYVQTPYSQLHGEFIPNLSVLDSWFMQNELS